MIIIFWVIAAAIIAHNKRRERETAAPPTKSAREIEREKARERARLFAISDIEFYEPFRRELIDEIGKLENARREAADAGYVETVDKLDEKIRRRRAEIFRIEKRLEKAHFILDE